MNKEEIKKIGKYLNFKYVIARDVNSNDKLETQDIYIQQLYDAYLDLRIKYNDLQSQLDIANKKLEDMKEYINYLVIFEPNIGRFNKTIWGEELLSIIGGE